MALPPRPLDTITETLFAAIRANDLKAVDAALASGADIDGEELHEFAIDRTLHRGSNTPLSLAIRLRHADIAHRLLAVPGVELDRGSCFAGETPLMIAARLGDADLVERLLDAGADPNCEEKYELCTAATFAIRGGYAALAIRLIEAGTDLDRFGHRLLREATNFRLEAVVALVTARGVKVTRKEARRRITWPWLKSD
jgi:Ankyrin repeats (3 copies)